MPQLKMNRPNGVIITALAVKFRLKAQRIPCLTKNETAPDEIRSRRNGGFYLPDVYPLAGNRINLTVFRLDQQLIAGDHRLGLEA